MGKDAALGVPASLPHLPMSTATPLAAPSARRQPPMTCDSWLRSTDDSARSSCSPRGTERACAAKRAHSHDASLKQRGETQDHWERFEYREARSAASAPEASRRHRVFGACLACQGAAVEVSEATI